MVDGIVISISLFWCLITCYKMTDVISGLDIIV